MRSYNIVRPRFWAWAKDKELSQNARELALYCLTSPHTNGIGCFRLPVAYIAEDLGTVSGTVRKTISELTEVGFLRHDDATGFVWIVGFLDHNPIANGNVGKSLVSFIDAVPRKAPFYMDFLTALERHAERLPDGFVDRLRNGIDNCLANRSTNGMPTHEHEHEHEHDAGAGDAPTRDLLAERADEDRAFAEWNSAAERVSNWPAARKLEGDRRKKLRSRINDAGGFEGFMDVLRAAEASRFCREDMNCFSLDWFLTASNFRKVSEGNYVDRGPPRPRPEAARPPMQI